MDFAAGNTLIQGMLKKPAAWHAERRKGVGGSDAGVIMSGEWTDLWLEKTGRREPEDLSNNLAVAMGTWTEMLNRFWFEQQTGYKVRYDPEPAIHLLHPFIRANLDGYVDAEGAVFEAKHVGAYIKAEDAVSRYFPQCQHLMAVTGAEMCYLSIFFGSAKWEYWDIGRDGQYITELIDKEAAFWDHVTRDDMPGQVVAAAPVAVSFDAMREVDLSTSNEWGAFADDWRGNKAAAKIFETATAELKKLVEPDVKRAIGGGIVATRSKTGAVTIKETK